jgi:hypothetical protein
LTLVGGERPADPQLTLPLGTISTLGSSPRFSNHWLGKLIGLKIAGILPTSSHGVRRSCVLRACRQGRLARLGQERPHRHLRHNRRPPRRAGRAYRLRRQGLGLSDSPQPRIRAATQCCQLPNRVLNRRRGCKPHALQLSPGQASGVSFSSCSCGLVDTVNSSSSAAHTPPLLILIAPSSQPPAAPMQPSTPSTCSGPGRSKGLAPPKP